MTQADENVDLTLSLGANWKKTNLVDKFNAEWHQDHYLVPVMQKELSKVMAEIGQYGTENKEIPDNLFIYKRNWIAREVPGRRGGVCPNCGKPY